MKQEITKTTIIKKIATINKIFAVVLLVGIYGLYMSVFFSSQDFFKNKNSVSAKLQPITEEGYQKNIKTIYNNYAKNLITEIAADAENKDKQKQGIIDIKTQLLDTPVPQSLMNFHFAITMSFQKIIQALDERSNEKLAQGNAELEKLSAEYQWLK